MNLTKPFKALFSLAIVSFGLGAVGYGQSATAINGLYYTGANNGGGLLAGGTQDSHWSVTYANVSGNNDNSFEGAAYVVSSNANTGGNSNYVDRGWVQNTATAQWITAPGARTSATGGNNTVNKGGDYLPGNGASGTNTSAYVYTLAFTIAGSGATGTAVTNQVAITLTIAADDQYQAYINPTLNANGSINAGASTLGGSGTSAWGNTQSITLQNFGTGGANNAAFKIGQNFLSVVVNNTNNIAGTSNSDPLNPSGLLVYQVYGDLTIDGRVVPEVGTWMPVVLALGLFVRRRFFRPQPTAA